MSCEVQPSVIKYTSECSAFCQKLKFRHSTWYVEMVTSLAWALILSEMPCKFLEFTEKRKRTHRSFYVVVQIAGDANVTQRMCEGKSNDKWPLILLGIVTISSCWILLLFVKIKVYVCVPFGKYPIKMPFDSIERLEPVKSTHARSHTHTQAVIWFHIQFADASIHLRTDFVSFLFMRIEWKPLLCVCARPLHFERTIFCDVN